MNIIKKRTGIIPQVAKFFAISILAIGLFTFFTQQMIAETKVTQQTERLAAEVAEEVSTAVKEYPAYEWLIRYWYEHCDELDIEYDAEFRKGTRTEKKVQLLEEHCPELQLNYASVSDVRALSAEDQKLFAEVTYSWLITRVNNIKRAFGIDYLFCVSTDNTYKEQFFLISAADPDSVRGTEYEQVYPLGVRVEVSPAQAEAMYNAIKDQKYLADAGDYVDYYAFLTKDKNRFVLIGMTYNLTELRKDIQSQASGGTSFAVFYQICLSGICMALIAHFVLRPLKYVQQNIRYYKNTKRSEDIIENLSEIRSRNEIGQLAEDIIELAKEIDDYTEKIAVISAEEERIGTELALAARIQESMLPNEFPPFPDRTEFEIYASMDPAKEVGGDFYDFFFIDDDHLCLVIADVSGKGIPAAMFMTVSKIILKNTAMLGKSPAETLETANSALYHNNQEEMFVTVWLGILEISTGKVIASNAGHEYPIVMQPDGSFDLFNDRHGFVIGGMEDVKYKNYEMQLQPGAKLFLYTDGLPEATDNRSNMFGTDRILTVLNKDTSQNPEQILHTVTVAVNDFVKEAEQFDDLTMLCIHYKGPKGMNT